MGIFKSFEKIGYQKSTTPLTVRKHSFLYLINSCFFGVDNSFFQILQNSKSTVIVGLPSLSRHLVLLPRVTYMTC